MTQNHSHVVLFKDVYDRVLNERESTHILFGQKEFLKRQSQDNSKAVTIDVILHSADYANGSVPAHLDFPLIKPLTGITIPVLNSPDIQRMLRINRTYPYPDIIGIKNQDLSFYKITPIGGKGLQIEEDTHYNNYAVLTPDEFFNSEVLFSEKREEEKAQKKAEYQDLITRINKEYLT
jgi:hypothetical protein